MTGRAVPRVQPEQAQLLLIDFQTYFVDGMAGDPEPVVARVAHLLQLARSFDVPVLATFEHPVDTKGVLPERLERAFPENGRRFVKRTFDLCSEPEIRAALLDMPRRQAIVAGAETDVCVLQSVLGLLELGFTAFVVEDCLFTSEQHPRPALERMRQAGAILLSYKTLYYELTRTVDAPRLYRAWNDAAGDDCYVNPEALPPSEPAT